MMHVTRSSAAIRRLTWAACLALLGGVASGRSLRAADNADAQPFVPGEISIGEPIVLPPNQAPPAAPAAAAPPGAVPGNGWLGIVVAESRTPGRWVVADVAAGSPAAAAGIRIGDDVRAINGTRLQSADDVSQSLTALAPGQAVSVAIARDESVADVRMTAVPRPAPGPARGWQAAPAEPAPSVLVPPPSTTPSRFAAPSAFAAAPASGFLPAAPAAVPGPTAPPPSVAHELPPPQAAPGGRGRTALGVRTVPIDAETQSRFRLPALRGAYVIGVVQDLPAARAGVPPGSVIVALDARPVGSPDDLTRMVTSGPVGRPVSLEYVLPGGAAKKADVVLQPLELPLERALLGTDPAAAPSVPALLPSPASGVASPVTEAFPYRANRPADAAALEAAREELRRLRARLDALERELGTAPAPRG